MAAFPNKLQQPKMTEHEHGRMRHAKCFWNTLRCFYFSFVKSLAWARL